MTGWTDMPSDVEPATPEDDPRQGLLKSAADVRDTAGRVTYVVIAIKAVLDQLPPEYDDALKSAACHTAAQVYGQAVGLESIRKGGSLFGFGR